MSNQRDRPFLESFWQNSVVCVCKSFLCDFECFIIRKLFLVNQDSKQFNCRDCWMSVIQLDLILLWEKSPVCHFHIVSVSLLESFDDVTEWSTWEEVLLLQSKLFATLCWVIWVEDRCDVFSALSLTNRSEVVTWIEAFEVEFTLWSRFPESEIVSVVSVVSWHWGIVCLCKDHLTTLPCASFLTICTCCLYQLAKEAYWVNDVSSLNLPRITLLEPEVWNLYLLSILNQLLENSIVVSDSVAPRRQFKSGHGVEEAGSEPSKTSVAKTSVSLLFTDIFKLVSKVIESLLVLLLHIDVDKHVLEGTAHQKLKGKIVDVLAVLSGVVGMGVIPRLNQPIAHRVGCSLVCSEIVEVEPCSCESVLNVIDDWPLDRALISANVSVHEIPQLVLLFSGLLFSVLKTVLGSESLTLLLFLLL